ncbi:DNA-processing protein DprA [Roseibacterium sp. SDUM158017]|nr:DNA-processing protein DprA [Roseibacterium sp. SDUM158017]MDG4648580.1 DNA-processing protein DprA [Roseibacterium sp. SDUM158017]
MRLRLIRSRRVGPATYLRLMAEHGHAEAALAALPGIARQAGVTDYAACPEAVATAELRAAARVKARIVCLGDADYPPMLADIPDPPPILWISGRAELLGRPAVAIVGTRNASALGARMTRRLARDLGEAGFVVVSGLARGIDAIAHDAALGTGTVAVHAGGLDVVYPAENAELAARIGKDGLRLSEMPFGLQPQARHFPRRNRIVSGLARGVVVVEAAARSGSLITARAALDQGREVMAVPGHPLDSRASGGNILLRDGATLIRGAEDVIELLGAAVLRPAAAAPRPATERPRAAPPLPEGGLEALILSLLGASPLAEDQLVRDTGRPSREVSQALAVLEMSGRITRSAGGTVARAD